MVENAFGGWLEKHFSHASPNAVCQYYYVDVECVVMGDTKPLAHTHGSSRRIDASVHTGTVAHFVYVPNRRGSNLAPKVCRFVSDSRFDTLED